MRVIGAGHVMFAAGLAGLGILSLLSGDFALAWQPVPPSIPLREILARASGALLLAAGIAMLLQRTAKTATLVMTAFLFSWVLLLQIPRAAMAPGNFGNWLGFAENVVLMSGGWILWAMLGGAKDGARIPKILFGLSCLILGTSHFVYSAATAGMVPAWLPVRLGFAYLTGVGHFAAGVGVLLGILPRLAATLEAVMITSFVLLIHVEGVAAEPHSRLMWTMLFVSTALAGAVWIIAQSFQSEPWGFSKKSTLVLDRVRA